jgi:hypothetical protein
LEELAPDEKNQINLYIRENIVSGFEVVHKSVLSNYTAVIPVRSLLSSRLICGGQTFALRGVSPSTSISPANFYSEFLSSAIMDWRNGPFTA